MTEKIKDLIHRMHRSDKVIIPVFFGTIVAVLAVLIGMVWFHIKRFGPC